MAERSDKAFGGEESELLLVVEIRNKYGAISALHSDHVSDMWFSLA